MTQDKLSEELACCPFCGGTASSEGVVRYSERHVTEQGWEQSEFYFCNCPTCGVSNLGIVGHRSKADAIAAWNRRAFRSATPMPEPYLADKVIAALSIQAKGE